MLYFSIYKNRKALAFALLLIFGYVEREFFKKFALFKKVKKRTRKYLDKKILSERGALAYIKNIKLFLEV